MKDWQGGPPASPALHSWCQTRAEGSSAPDPWPPDPQTELAGSSREVASLHLPSSPCLPRSVRDCGQAALQSGRWAGPTSRVPSLLARLRVTLRAVRFLRAQPSLALTEAPRVRPARLGRLPPCEPCLAPSAARQPAAMSSHTRRKVRFATRTAGSAARALPERCRRLPPCRLARPFKAAPPRAVPLPPFAGLQVGPAGQYGHIG